MRSSVFASFSAPMVALMAALSLLEGTPARGQEPPVPPAPPEVQAAVEKAQAEAAQQFDKAQQQFQALQREFAQTPGATPGSGGVGGYAGPRAFTDRLQNIIRRAPGGPGKTLVIRSSETDPKEQANLEEDLAVMSHILDKALEEKLGDQPPGRKAMGIDVFFATTSTPIRNLYLDGYGAVFMLNVSFPLLTPPAKPETEKERPPVDSTWEEARQEVYGQRPDGAATLSPVEEYSEEKVSKLKDAVLEGLKNATNIRDLKSDEAVTVCVFGGGSAARARRAGTGAHEFRPKATTTPVPPAEAENEVAEVVQNGAFVRSHAPTRGTILTIRVKKSDAEAFAKGKLTLDEFRKKARIAAYAGDVGGGGSFSWSGSGFGGAYGVTH